MLQKFPQNRGTYSSLSYAFANRLEIWSTMLATLLFVVGSVVVVEKVFFSKSFDFFQRASYDCSERKGGFLSIKK